VSLSREKSLAQPIQNHKLPCKNFAFGVSLAHQHYLKGGNLRTGKFRKKQILATSAMRSMSGAVIAHGLKRALTLSGSSVRPAYPGFIYKT
jgi:hypothetical protein